jgi:hypothetical protein
MWRHCKRAFLSDIIVRKILDASYWWSMMNQDVHEYCETYDQCQITEDIFN